MYKILGLICVGLALALLPCTAMPNFTGMPVTDTLQSLEALHINEIHIEWLCTCVDHTLDEARVDSTIPAVGQPIDVSVTVVAFIPGCPH